MGAFLAILVVLAMFAALGTLGLGLIGMARGGDPRHANKLMRLRVLMQGLALLFFAIFMLFFHHH